MKLFTVTWSTDTAGPSPYNNMRTEVFLKGCHRAIIGSPCAGCFNSKIWDDEAEITHTPKSIAEQINEFAPNKFVTIGGGEPLDQLPELIELTKELKAYGFNIMIYSWRQLKCLLKDDYEGIIPTYHKEGYRISKDIKELLKNIDIFVDGQFKSDEKLYNPDAKDGLTSSIGSGNQIFWSVKANIGYEMSNIRKINLKENEEIVFIVKSIENKIVLEME